MSTPQTPRETLVEFIDRVIDNQAMDYDYWLGRMREVREELTHPRLVMREVPPPEIEWEY